MKYYMLTLMAMLLSLPAYALDVVYPKQNEVTISAPSTFFVGSAERRRKLTINGEQVDVHKSGGFAHVVKLKDGVNEFVIKSGSKEQIFKITKPVAACPEKITVPTVNLELPFTVLTTKDKTPLRSTAQDFGINRLSHFQKDIPLNVVGFENGFYKVKLNEEKFAWVGKSDVKQTSFDSEQAKLVDKTSVEDNDYYIFKMNFSKKIPYVIESGYPFVVKFYNVEGYEDNTFEFSFPLKQKIFGYSGEFDGNTFVLKIRKYPEINEEKPLKDIKIVIDPGHGGNELGAIGCLRDAEKDVNLAIAKDLASELKFRGADVVMTRNSDEEVSLNERVEITNKYDGMIFISLHGNALPDGADPIANKGTSIYYYYNQAKPLADSIIKNVTTQTDFDDDKVRRGSLAVVRNTNALSILIEVGYLINPDDNARLIDKKVQKQVAKYIADGIEEYLEN